MAEPAKPSPSPRRKAVANAAGGGATGVLLVWILDLFGVDLTPAAGAILAGMVVTAFAALGRDGISGLAHRLWRGVNGDDDEEESHGT